MAKREKKVKSLFEISGNTIRVKEEDLIALSNDEEQSAKVAALKKLGYELELVKPEPKTRKTFTKAKAEAYIKAYDKKSLKAFAALEKDSKAAAAAYTELVAAHKKGEASAEEVAEARKTMIRKSREAFTAQKKYFRDTFGDEAYETVKGM